jgi:hypothetical protein
MITHIRHVRCLYRLIERCWPPLPPVEVRHSLYADKASYKAEDKDIAAADADEGEPEDDLRMNEGGEASSDAG